MHLMFEALRTSMIYSVVQESQISSSLLQLISSLHWIMTAHKTMQAEIVKKHILSACQQTTQKAF